FLTKFDTSGIQQWGSYLGGAGADGARCLQISSKNEICLGGFTQSSTGIATPGAYLTSLSGSGDCLLAKICDQAPELDSIAGNNKICIGSKESLLNGWSGGTWLSVNGNVTIDTVGVLTGVTDGYDTVL